MEFIDKKQILFSWKGEPIETSQASRVRIFKGNMLCYNIPRGWGVYWHLNSNTVEKMMPIIRSWYTVLKKERVGNVKWRVCVRFRDKLVCNHFEGRINIQTSVFWEVSEKLHLKLFTLKGEPVETCQARGVCLGGVWRLQLSGLCQEQRSKTKLSFNPQGVVLFHYLYILHDWHIRIWFDRIKNQAFLPTILTNMSKLDFSIVPHINMLKKGVGNK